MSDFYSKRRERFLNEEPYVVQTKGRTASIQDYQRSPAEEIADAGEFAWHGWNWFIASNKLELLVLNYSAGEPISELVQSFEDVLAAQEPSALPHPTQRTEPVFLEQLDGYHYAMTLLSLAKLLRHDDLIPRVAVLFDVARTENRGKDALYEALLGKLGFPTVPAESMLRFLKAHPLLLKAVEAEPQKRPLFIAEFLKTWYPAMKGTYWHGLHDRAPQSFFGYLAFEAGLVTYLWDIDDSSYRDLPFYPKDLVDYARSKRKVLASRPSIAS